MKTLLSTTALALALGLPMMTMAQTNPPASAPATQSQANDMPGFLGALGQSDILASDLMGHDVHARRAPVAMTTAPATAGATRDMALMNRADLDDMDKIGQINEIVLSNDGRVRAIVIGIGGFLGMGERDVAVTMDQVMFATDPEDRSLTYVVVNTGADMLKGSPVYDRTLMRDGMAQTSPGLASSNRAALNRPEIARDGYTMVEAKQVSAELLVGKSVYGVNDKSVGTVDDLIVDDAGAISNVIIDFGGFLGMGTNQVSLDFDELTILTNDGNADVRVYVDASKEQIQALPRYEATN